MSFNPPLRTRIIEHFVDIIKTELGLDLRGPEWDGKDAVPEMVIYRFGECLNTQNVKDTGLGSRTKAVAGHPEELHYVLSSYFRKQPFELAVFANTPELVETYTEDILNRVFSYPILATKGDSESPFIEWGDITDVPPMKTPEKMLYKIAVKGYATGRLEYEYVRSINNIIPVVEEYGFLDAGESGEYDNE